MKIHHLEAHTENLKSDPRTAAPIADPIQTSIAESDVAIVGMAARLPGARNTEEYWRNLRDGVESIQTYSDDQLQAAGESPENLRNPNYVRVGGPLQDMEMFDGEFFGFSPKESAILDPQHRHFMECCWEALEDAGHPPERFGGPIGMFAGCGMGSYFYFNLCTNRDLVDSVGLFLLRHTGNDKDFLATRISYLLDLKGPSINVQTACSTSLVATHLACQSLLSRECDMALAGGVTIEIPHRRGYVYREGEVLSPDGHCHAFDHRAQGTLLGSGAVVVVLRRLQDAIDDGDHIHAVIRGSAVNNDGARKAGYLAPSVDGQAAAMTEAHALADISAETIDYVECHGTGTYLGDPIEIAALTLAFRQSTQNVGFCRIGSVKTNIGHLDTAAGVASLIKVALALRHRQIPPSLNFEKPNPSIEFASSPFIVNDRLTEWRRRSPSSPRRAAVNSLGVGGTNAHVVLEEAPERVMPDPARREYQLLAMSARNRKSLAEYQKRLAAHLRDHPEQELADVAHTLFQGRRAFQQRRVLAAKDRDEAIRLLEQGDSRRVFTGAALEKSSVVFMFPGGGSQYARMGLDLYTSEPTYKEYVDRGLEIFRHATGTDLRPLMFPAADQVEAAAEALEHPRVQLPAIFIVEIALAKLWMSWGIEPAALIGHSVGENAAACLSGVLSYEDALGLVILRGKLGQQVATGAMLTVALSAPALEPLVQELGLDLAIVNSPQLCVVSGGVAGIDALEKRLLEREIESSRLKITAAGHSRMLEPILDEFGAYLRKLKLNAPKIPFVSNFTGTWIKPEEATDPAYWVRHFRHTIRFSDGMETLLETPDRVFLEVGPGRILSSFVRAQAGAKAGQPVLSSLRRPGEKIPDTAYFLTVLGRLWASGVKIDSDRLWQGEKRLRVPLPTYAFQHQRYFIDAVKAESRGPDLKNLQKLPRLDEWFYRPVWRDRGIDRTTDDKQLSWLVFMDDAGIGRRLVERLRRRGHSVVEVRAGDAYHRSSDTEYVLSPERGREGYDTLVKDLVASGKVPNRIAHLWLAAREEIFRPGSSLFHTNMERGFYSLLFLAQALADENVPRPLHITAVSNGMQQIDNEPLPYPEKAAALGPIKVIPRELSGVTCSSIDMELPKTVGAFGLRRLLGKGGEDGSSFERAIDALERELMAVPENGVIVHRDGKRFVQEFERSLPAKDADQAFPIRKNGVYLITGGLGGLGLVMANYLAEQASAKLVLLGRTPLPERGEWEAWLRQHGSEDRVSRSIEQVRALEAKGAEVLTAAADVTDIEGMRETVAAARTRFGAVHGVIHAAGVVSDGLIQLKALADVEDVFAPKIHGTVVLDSVFADAELDFMVLFSSVSTVTAPAGQVDYVAANAFLNAYASSRTGPGERRRTIAINWGIWNEVGKAAEALLGPEPVAVGTRTNHRDGAKSATAAHQGTEKPVTHPMFDRFARDAHGESVLMARYSPATHWILDEHRTLQGDALVPGTGYLELARAALEEYGERGSFEMRDLFFFRPLQVVDQEAKEVRVKLKRSEEGYSFEVRGRRSVDGRTGWELHAQAELLLHELPAAGSISPAEVSARCQIERLDTPGGMASPQERQIRFGPRWRVLRQASFGRDEAIARLELDAKFAADLDSYKLHPALVDVATGYALKLIGGYDSESLWIPVSYRKVQYRAPLTPTVYSWVRNHGPNSVDRGIALFDVTITDEAGRVLLEVEEFTVKKVAGAADFAVVSRPLPSEIEYERPVESARQLSPAEQQLQRNLLHGILPAEGAEAFGRVICATAQAQWVVTSLDLAQLLEQVAQAGEPASAVSSAGFARPELDSEYVGPRDEFERTIAGFWQELLGVEKVGVRDSFFDLGGHSLIAVRLFAKIKKAYQVDFPISVLFESPTIEGCAAMIRDAVGGVPASAEGSAAIAPAARESHRSRYTHLVGMHPGEGGPRRPFFLIAGMFGNVLNLRHLAHLIGTDRPFYGLQARGLYGDHAPHETFEEMARDYLKELRTIQPKGPYLLGGFSGGGITAYEMAQQLRAQGEETALLVMLDSNIPGEPTVTRWDMALIHLQRLQRIGPAYPMTWARNRIRWEKERFQKRFGAPEEKQQPYELHNEAIEAAFRRAFSRYRVAPYPGTVNLFRPKLDYAYVLGPGRVLNSALRYVYHDNGWGNFVGGMVVHEVPGSHDSMVLEPNVRVVAARLRACIQKAEADFEKAQASVPVRDASILRHSDLVSQD